MRYIKRWFIIFSFGLLFSCSTDRSELENNKSDSILLKKTNSQWNERDLYAVKFYQKGNLKPVESDESFLLEEGLIIESISQKQFELSLQDGYRHYLKDTLLLVKKNGSISIENTILKDVFYSNGRVEKYNYLGYFPVLNQYLVRGEYSDSLDYKLIDKPSGQIKQSFISYPIISKNANFVAVSKTSEIYNETYLEIYKFSEGYYSKVFKAIFTNWSVVDFDSNAFWGNDGSLYLKAALNNEKRNVCYLKITLD